MTYHVKLQKLCRNIHDIKTTDPNWKLQSASNLLLFNKYVTISTSMGKKLSKLLLQTHINTHWNNSNTRKTLCVWTSYTKSWPCAALFVILKIWKSFYWNFIQFATAPSTCTLHIFDPSFRRLFLYYTFFLNVWRSGSFVKYSPVHMPLYVSCGKVKFYSTYGRRIWNLTALDRREFNAYAAVNVGGVRNSTLFWCGVRVLVICVFVTSTEQLLIITIELAV